MGFLFWYICPIFKPFPAPTGPYKVGTIAYTFTDADRKEKSSFNNEFRSVVVRLFYPAQAFSNSHKYPYLMGKISYVRDVMSRYYHIPAFLTKCMFSHLQTHSYFHVKVADTQMTYPVVLFSHGLLGLPSDMYLGIIENIASHGYIVAAIDHPYFNIATQINEKLMSSDELSKAFNSMKSAEQKDFQTDAIEIYKADMKFALDQLADFNSQNNNIFYHRLDLDHVAVMGHSAGGTASIEFCRVDNRCKAAINLDGWYDHVIGNEPIKRPLLLLFAEKSLEISEPTSEYLKRKSLTREQYFEREKNISAHRKALCNTFNCTMEIIPQATHTDFEDTVLLKWPLRSWNAVDSHDTLELINGHIMKFLHENLD